MTVNTLKIGGHLSTSGGYCQALKKISELKGNCLQIFSSSPMTWKSAHIDEGIITEFLQLKKELKINNVYFHALYLINLANDNDIGEKSVETLVNELNLASKLDIKGTIVHTGSFKTKDSNNSIKHHRNYEILLKNIRNILKNTPQNTFLILENAGNRKIGEKISHLAEIIHDIKDSRLKICLDTCHLHASGYNLSDEKSFNNFFLEFKKTIGLESLELIHLNDSKDPFNSLRDRHENLLAGNVGKKVFQNFLNSKYTCNLPFILEVPGFEKNGVDLKNLEIAKSLSFLDY